MGEVLKGCAAAAASPASCGASKDTRIALASIFYNTNGHDIYMRRDQILCQFMILNDFLLYYADEGRRFLIRIF